MRGKLLAGIVATVVAAAGVAGAQTVAPVKKAPVRSGVDEAGRKAGKRAPKVRLVDSPTDATPKPDEPRREEPKPDEPRPAPDEPKREYVRGKIAEISYERGVFVLRHGDKERKIAFGDRTHLEWARCHEGHCPDREPGLRDLQPGTKVRVALVNDWAADILIHCPHRENEPEPSDEPDHDDHEDDEPSGDAARKA